MSDGWVATQATSAGSWVAPSTAWWRAQPSSAEHPEPGSRLLHGVVRSWK